MRAREQEKAVIERLVEWGTRQEAVRAMVLTSTRTVPGGQLDLFSDYDVILALTDVLPFHEDRGWLEAFGRVLVLYHDPLIPDGAFETSGYVTQYEDGLKIDFGLWPVGLLQRVAAEPELPEELDAGYLVLLDKDGLTEGLKPPAYKAYIPKPPAQAEYLERVELFFHNGTYVAKYLWRDDLIAAKHLLHCGQLQDDLLPMLVWHLETEHQWSVKPGPYGRRLKKWLRSDLWKELECTYTGPGIEETWEALFRTIALFRRVAREVGERLGYAYPEELDRRATAYLQRVRALDPRAESF